MIFLIDFIKAIKIATPIIVVANAILSPEKYIIDIFKLKKMIVEERKRKFLFNMFLYNIIKKILIKKNLDK